MDITPNDFIALAMINSRLMQNVSELERKLSETTAVLQEVQRGRQGASDSDIAGRQPAG